MIVVERAAALYEFAALVLESMSPWPADCAGAFFWGYVEPGFSNSTHRLYRPDGRAYLLEEPRASRDARTAMLDIPDEVDSLRAETAAVLVTNRVTDGSWVARVAFAEEARGLRPRPFAADELATQVCPL